MNNRMARMDIGLFIAVLVLLGFGIVFVYSSSFAVAQQRFGGSDFFLARQTIRALLAIISFMVFINVDYHIWGRLSNLFYVASIILLVIVLFLPEINGARRWISIGQFSFQVSDFARMALIMVIARNCERAGDEIKNWNVLSKILLKTGIVCGLILLEPNFSTALILALIGLMMLFLSGARFIHLATLAVSTIPVMFVLVLKTPYRKARITGFLNIISEQSNLGYQAFQSLIGLGNGGIFGVGLGKGEQKFFYLPEPHTDFMISILGEETGFIGLLIIISIYAFIIFRGMKISLNAPDRMGQLMSFGFTSVITLYLLFHAAVGTGLVPTTGIPLPFLSYGGMSLIFMMSSVGILLNISSQADVSAKVPQGIRSERLIKV
ncbi:MAG TPA: putative peptidoglycan glycosyltransferase FtsW [Chitinispirillaceae bacterium]|nr:putative peptidoglycan glycosyltransferase FtsW [Chitinispirillaceae bacterium]